MRNEEEMQVFALEGKESQWSPRGLSKSTHLISGISPNCRSLHQFSETPTLSRGTSFNSCHSAASIPQRYVISRHFLSREIVLFQQWVSWNYKQALEKYLLNESVREWIKDFQTPAGKNNVKVSEVGLNICHWGNGQINYWLTHFMEFYIVIKGIDRDNFTNLEWSLSNILRRKNQDAERYIEYVTVYKANKWKL